MITNGRKVPNDNSNRTRYHVPVRTNSKTSGNITKYVVDKCYSKDELFNLPDIIDFPYRKYYLGDTIVKSYLEKIFTIEPIIRREKWNIPDGKIITKLPMFKELYNLLEIVFTSSDDHWIYDQVIDYYSEYARINTPGYGEKYSPYDYWKNPKLRQRWISLGKENNTLEDIREMIYRSLQEARPAYSTISKSLYSTLMEFNIKDTYKVLDIAAYGERAIGASSLYNVSIYDGVDPNYDLIPGHDNLSMDLESLNPDCQVRFIHVGLEDYKTSRRYDIITYSPPPYNTEPYGSASSTQSYIKYPTFEEYFCCFLTELIYKARILSNKNAIFAFTALDRNPEKYPPRIIDKEQISENLELVYVEALLLVVSCYGFFYQGAIGLAAGGKQAGVPWWVFKYNETLEPFYLQLLKEHYPNIFNTIAPRIISNYHGIVGNISPLFEEYITITKTKKYNISTYLPKKTNIMLELIRLYIQQYVVEIVSSLTKVKIDKVKVILGRYLMMKSINATYKMPWKACLYVDPIFPTNSTNEKSNDPISDQIVTYFIEQNVSKELANSVVYNYKYWFASYECIGLNNLYNSIANYIPTLPLSNTEVNVSKQDNNTIINGNSYAVELLKRVPHSSKMCGINKILWKGQPTINNLLAYLRYETLGAQGHQYTRPKEKTQIIEKIFKMPVIDIYASIFNNQSEKYCSIYPDVEENSIGSAFCLKMIEGAYLANPVDVPVFLKVAISNIIEDLHSAKTSNKNLLISMGFTVWLDVESNFISEFESIHYSKIFKKSYNIGLNILADSEFILATYILDKNKFPSVLLDKQSNRSNTLSIGVILGSQNNTIDKDAIIQLVENTKYVQYK